MGSVWDLLAPAALTMAIETAILFAVGYRSRLFIAVCLLINLATNVTLNLGLSLLDAPAYWWASGPAEAAVVAVEWAVLRLVAPATDPRRGWRLLGFVFLANLTSAACGPLLFW